MSHGVLVKLFGLLKSKTHDEEDEGEHDTDSQTSSPNRAVVAIVASSCDNI